MFSNANTSNTPNMVLYVNWMSIALEQYQHQQQSRAAARQASRESCIDRVTEESILKHYPFSANIIVVE